MPRAEDMEQAASGESVGNQETGVVDAGQCVLLAHQRQDVYELGQVVLRWSCHDARAS
jgi:hypothetical protein